MGVFSFSFSNGSQHWNSKSFRYYHHALQVQGKLTEQQARTKEAEETIEALKKENGTMKGHGVKLKNAQKEIERLREAWTDKDVQLAEANSNASQQRHVSFCSTHSICHDWSCLAAQCFRICI